MNLFARILFVSFLSVCISACNNESDKEKVTNTDSTTNINTQSNLSDTTKPDTSGREKVAFDATIEIPVFKMTHANFVDLKGKNPKKLLFTLEMLDLNKPATGINLMVFAAKSHKHYAREDNPLTISDKKGLQEIASHVVIGNNELAFNYFEQGTGIKEFDHVLFTPRIRPMGTNAIPYLTFDVRAFDKDGKPIVLKFKNFDLTNTNPSPPATPSPED